ncbi:MAG: caspase family protein, partial [Bacteroidetes bacterium]
MVMRKLCFLLVLAGWQFLALLHAQQTFIHHFGGELDEYATAVIQCSDGGYLLAGPTNSYGSGSSDIWVMKLDPDGQQLWRKLFGGRGTDLPHDLIETTEGEYVLAGYTQNSRGEKNALVFKIDHEGRMLWHHTFGGEDQDEARSIIQTRDGGFAVCGNTRSFAAAEIDIWVLRLDSEGEKIWENTVRSQSEEMGRSIVQTQDGGFVIAGYRDMSDKAAGEDKNADMILVKLNARGKGVWRKKLYGDVGNEVAEAIVETPEGDLVVAGWTQNPATRSMDGMLLKVNHRGNAIWKRTYGRSGRDLLYDLTPTADGGYALIGETADAQGIPSDLWLLRVDEDGRSLWERRLGDTQEEVGFSIDQAFDGGFVLGGLTKSFSEGGRDMWIVKTNLRGDTEPILPLIAQNIEDNSSSRNWDATLPGAGFKPNLYVLAVGVSRYNDPNVNLTFAHTDAEAVADRFKELEGTIYSEVKVKKILNEDATLVNLKMGISWLEREATQHDVILMFISSHGALDHKGNLYILPTDFNSYNLFATALNIRDLTEGVNGVPCKKLIFLDACHSGQSAYNLLDFASVKAANVNKIVEEVLGVEPGLTVMTSSSGREYSYENPKWGHGAFTKAILEGLDGQADLDLDEV